MTTQINSELLREFFEFDVTIKGDLAKWQNHKHPDNANFQQVVFWAAYPANGNLIVVYYLDSTCVNKNVHHACISLDGKSFEDAVFEYWAKS